VIVGIQFLDRPFRERVDDLGHLGHQERGHQLRAILHRVGVAGIIGPRIRGVLFDRRGNYQAAF